MGSKWGGARATKIRQALAHTLPRPCWRCGITIHPTDEWDVGHRVAIVDGGSVWGWDNLAPEHRAGCNRAAGARHTNQAKSRKHRRLRNT